MKRRTLLKGAAIGSAAFFTSSFPAPVNAALKSGEAFRPLPVLDARNGSLELEARNGETAFAGGQPSATKGFNGAYLGPVILMRRGTTVDAKVTNATGDPVSCHWHGLNVPSNADGGAPQSAIEPGTTWSAVLPVDQPAATLWYHTHIHGRTAPDVHAGLAGAIILEDEASAALALPSNYGVDDLTLILQDKDFDRDRRTEYVSGMMAVMHGSVGETVLVNGQLSPDARVPAGPVRLRLINACTAALLRIPVPKNTVLIATDQGLLPATLPMTEVFLAPGERVEIIADMSAGGSADINVSAGHASGMGSMMGGGGMMGEGMMGNDGAESSATQTMLRLTADPSLPASPPVPSKLVEGDAGPSELKPTGDVRTFAMAAGMGPSMMVRRLVGGQSMTINGKSYKQDRIDFTVRQGSLERWRVSGAMMGHPFHAHGVKFQIADPQRPEETGWKDTVLVEGTRDLIVRIEARSESQVPFMFHCHILEHEDAGMMGQFLST